MTNSQSFLTPEIEKQLSYPKYWNKDYTLWGSLADWDIYFINEMPGLSCAGAHKTLANELDILMNHFPENSREWSKAKAIRKQLKLQKTNSATTTIWKKHQEDLLKVTVENKINENINKRKIEDVARNAVSAAAEACYASEISKRQRTNNKNSGSGTSSSRTSTSGTSSSRTSTSGTSSSGTSTSGTSPIEPNLKKFEKEYLELDPNCMWRLKSGRKVEEIIYNFARDLSEESYLHSFIINDSDLATKSLFTEEEWKEITTSEIRSKSNLENSLVELLKTYTVDNVERLREVLSEPFTPDNCKYDRKLHFDLDYINNAYRGILRLWEMEENPIIDSLLEGWYEMNIWSRLVDPAFDNMNIDLVRGEGMSLASSDRKNLERTIGNTLNDSRKNLKRAINNTDLVRGKKKPGATNNTSLVRGKKKPEAKSNRKKIGRKGDGVFRLHKDRLEFGAIEAGRKWEGQCGTKYMTDSLKICKMLKDMLNQLAIECGMKENLVRKLQVVGMLHGANRIQVITVDLPKGYITRIHRRKVHEVSGRISKSKPLALVLKEILIAKFIIKQTLDIINKKDDFDSENFLYDSDEQDGYLTPPTVTLYKTFATPEIERTKDVIKNDNE